MESGLESFETMYSEATRLKDPTTEAEALFRIGWISFYMHRPGRAEDFLLKAIDLGEDQGRDEILLKACSSLGFAYAVFSPGHFPSVKDWTAQKGEHGVSSISFNTTIGPVNM